MIKKKKKRPKVASLSRILSLGSLIYHYRFRSLESCLYLSGLALEQIGFSK
jgi:hypothetical protein